MPEFILRSSFAAVENIVWRILSIYAIVVSSLVVWLNGVCHMASSLNLSLTDELREFINSRVGDTGLYATPSEYLRDLIRRDMGAQATLSHIMDGLDDIKQGRFSDKSILDILEEDEL